jgi:PAS domain S-box-containing protein
MLKNPALIKAFKIVVVDDDEGLNHLVCKSLKREGFECVQAFNGEQAIDILNPESNQIFLLDYRLPDFNGDKVINLIRDKYGIIPPFIVMTGFGDEKIAVDMIRLGAKHYIVKEAEFVEILIEKIHLIIDEIKQQRELEETKDQLETSLQDYKLLFNTMLEGIVIQDSKGKIISANPAAENILGLKLSQLTGLKSTDPCWKAVDENNKELPGENHPAMLALKTGKKVENFLMGIYNPQKNDQVWMLVNAVPQFKNGESSPFQVYSTFTDITKRKNAEKQLKENEHKYRFITENTLDGIFTSDKNGNITYASPSYIRQLGYDKDVVLSKGKKEIFETIHPDEREGAFDKIYKSIEKKESGLILTFRAKKVSGSYIWREDHIAFNYDMAGNFNGSTIISRDITKRKKAEQALKLNEKRLESLLKIAQKTTSSLQELLDYALHEAIDLTSSKIGYIYFYDEDRRHFILNTWSKEVMKECAVQNPQTIYKLDDTGCWGEAVRQRKPIIINDYEADNPIKQGTPVGHVKLKKFLTIPVMLEGKIVAVAGVANKEENYDQTDITQLSLLMDSVWKISERISLLNELTRAKEKAEENEFELNEAQKISHVGNWKFDIETQQPVWSDEMLRIWGLKSQDEVPCYEDHKKYIHPEDWEKFNKSIKQTIEDKEPYELELRIIRPDGSERNIVTIGEPLLDENNNVFALRGTNQDITERKNVEKELIEAKVKAEESDRLKSAFLANMSHEIRTPMNGILGFTELLREPNLTGTELQQYIEIIRKSGARMLDTVSDLVDISRIETGQVEIKEEGVNLKLEIENLYAFFEPEAKNKSLEFKLNLKCNSQESFILSDRSKFNSIVSNLIKNALKYTKAGSVEVGCEQINSHFLVYVKDTGIGIPIEMQKKIFERFVQVEQGYTRNYEGTGLGLTISKAYADMLNGDIWVESMEGKGSTFYFKIPVKKIGSNVKSATNKVSKPETTPDKINILIAEDDETSVKFLEYALADINGEKLFAKNGIEAVNLFYEHHDIDLVLMDIKMPKMDGYEATRKIRELNNNVIIIAQTAYAMAGDYQKALEAGCNDYITKPLSIDDLKSKIFQQLRNKNQEYVHKLLE